MARLPYVIYWKIPPPRHRFSSYFPHEFVTNQKLFLISNEIWTLLTSFKRVIEAELLKLDECSQQEKEWTIKTMTKLILTSSSCSVLGFVILSFDTFGSSIKDFPEGCCCCGMAWFTTFISSTTVSWLAEKTERKSIMYQYELRKVRKFSFWEFQANFTAVRLRRGGHFVKILSKVKRGKIKNRRFFWSNWMKTEHVLFPSNTQKSVGTCQKLAFKRPIVV